MQQQKRKEKIRHALVLGGSGDLGVAVVREFVANGVKAVSFTYGSNLRTAARLAKELKKKGVKTYFASPDLLDDKAFRAFLDKAVRAVGEEITTMVNTVAISPDRPLKEQTVELWRRVLDVNLISSFIVTRAVADRMKRKGIPGSIVLVASDNGINAHSPFSAPYDSSKAAQIHKTKNIAEPYAPGVRINSVSPGCTAWVWRNRYWVVSPLSITAAACSKLIASGSRTRWRAGRQ